MMKPLLCNRPEDLVRDALAGLVAATPHLALLKSFPSLKVVYDSTFDGDAAVAVISGGGSGHEPAFAGLVGAGALAAAAAGDVFAAPPEDAVLAAIRQVTGAKGCLLVSYGPPMSPAFSRLHEHEGGAKECKCKCKRERERERDDVFHACRC